MHLKSDEFRLTLQPDIQLKKNSADSCMRNKVQLAFCYWKSPAKPKHAVFAKITLLSGLILLLC